MENDKELKAIQAILSSLEGLDAQSQERVFKYVLERVGVALAITRETSITEAGLKVDPFTPKAPVATDMGKILDIRTLKEQKNPRSAIQMTVLVAYYLQNVAPIAERSETVGTSDIEKYFKQAGFKLPAGINGSLDALNNAKRSGYLEVVGRGTYKLNPVGYNLVAYSLPEGGSSKNGKAKKTKAKKPNKKR